jgi:hypothetical protein
MLAMTDEKPMLVNTMTYLQIALQLAILVALVEIPILYLNVIPAAFVFIGGWILISGYTFYRVWQLSTQSLVVNDMNFAKVIGCVFIIGLMTTLLYLGIATSYKPASDNIAWRIKGAFAGNFAVALDSATLAVFATFVVEQVRTLLNQHKL